MKRPKHRIDKDRPPQMMMFRLSTVFGVRALDNVISTSREIFVIININVTTW